MKLTSAGSEFCWAELNGIIDRIAKAVAGILMEMFMNAKYEGTTKMRDHSH